MKRITRLVFVTLFIFTWASQSDASLSPNKKKIEYDGPEIEVDLDYFSETEFFMMDMDYALNSATGYIPQGLPCEGVITSHFGWRKISRRRGRGRMHLGTDIAGPVGTMIYAPAAGKVTFSGVKGGYGRTIILDHGNNIHTLYGHNSELLVKEGDWVNKGQGISKMGSTGRSTGSHLHYEVRVSGNPVNPKKFF